MIKNAMVEFRDKSSNLKTGLSHEGKYRYLGECKVKNPQTREWYEAVMYQEADLGGEIYVREKEEFNKKFKES